MDVASGKQKKNIQVNFQSGNYRAMINSSLCKAETSCLNVVVYLDLNILKYLSVRYTDDY